MVYAMEFVMTEKLLTNSGVGPLTGCGIIGLWGTMLSVPMFLCVRITPSWPPQYAPLWHEDIMDSLNDLKAWSMSGISGMFAGMLAFNTAAFEATALLSANARAMLAASAAPVLWFGETIMTGGADLDFSSGEVWAAIMGRIAIIAGAG